MDRSSGKRLITVQMYTNLKKENEWKNVIITDVFSARNTQKHVQQHQQQQQATVNVHPML